KAPVAQLTYTENLTSIKDLAGFLKKGVAKARESVDGPKDLEIFAAKGKNAEGKNVTTLYIAEKANECGNLPFDKYHQNNFHLRRKTARTSIAAILKNSLMPSEGDKNDDKRAVKSYKKDVHVLMTNVIDRDVQAKKKLSDNKSFSLDGLKSVVDGMVDVMVKAEETTHWVSENMAKYKAPPPPLGESNSKILPGKGVELSVLVNEEVENRTFPNFETDGKVFEAEKWLGGGSFGIVVLYKAESGERRAVKFAPHFELNKDQIEENEETSELHEKHEVNAKRELAAGRKYASKHILGYTDFIKLANDTIMLIGEAANGGGVEDFSEKLHKADISQESRGVIAKMLTLDGAKGIQSLQRKGAIHGDMKPENQVIDNGELKIIDLATVSQGPKLRYMLGDVYVWGSHSYNAPEAFGIALDDLVDDTEEKARKDAVKMRDERMGKLVKALGAIGAFDENLTAVQFKERYKDLFLDAALAHEAEKVGVIDAKVDVFGLGQTTYALLTGRDPLDARFERALEDVEKEENSDKLGSKESSERVDRADDMAQAKKAVLARTDQAHGLLPLEMKRHTTPFKNRALLDATGNKELDPLLDQMESPDPSKRPSIRDVVWQLEDKVSKDEEELGRKLIQLIDREADSAEIEKADKELQELLDRRTIAEDDSVEGNYQEFVDRSKKVQLNDEVTERLLKPIPSSKKPEEEFTEQDI
ncbi:MAG: hypothetical protein AAFN76_01430, partial [Pseudomonadota bacterium]